MPAIMGRNLDNHRFPIMGENSGNIGGSRQVGNPMMDRPNMARMPGMGGIIGENA